jgi:hypothetical protein
MNNPLLQKPSGFIDRFARMHSSCDHGAVATDFLSVPRGVPHQPVCYWAHCKHPSPAERDVALLT